MIGWLRFLKRGAPVIARGPVRKPTELLRDETAATAIEYAMIAAFIALVIIGSVKGIATNLKSVFGNVASNVH